MMFDLVSQLASTAPAQLLIASLWQGLLLTAIASACLMIAERLGLGLRASSRFVIWLMVFLLVALLPFLSVLQGRPTLGSGSSLLHLDTRWAFALECVWLLASLFSLFRFGLSCMQMRRLVRNADPVPFSLLSPSLQAIVSQPNSRRLEVRLSDTLDAPGLAGFLHPAVIVPRSMWTELTSGELEAIVLHEKAHLDRGDDWTNLLQKLLRALCPLNPALLWAERSLCREREQACDDAVLQAAGDGRAYATCLTKLAESRLVKRAAALAPGLWKKHSELAMRVDHILHPRRTLGAWLARGVMTGCMTIAVASAVMLACAPGLISFEHSGGSAGLVSQAARGQILRAPSVIPPRLQEASFHATAKLPVKNATMNAATKHRLRPARFYAATRVQYWELRNTGDGAVLVLFTVELPRQASRLGAVAQPALPNPVVLADWFGDQI